ncbi:MAG: hypothetical protein ACLPSF_02655 [Methylocella sp.]
MASSPPPSIPSPRLPARNGAQAEVRVAALQEAVTALAAELRLVDVADYIAFIRCEHFANIQDIVNSSVELFFRPGALSYGWSAEFELDWESAPKIVFDMEFRHRTIRIVFKLALWGHQSSVSIEYFSASEPAGDEEADTRRMIEALAEARLPSPPR